MAFYNHFTVMESRCRIHVSQPTLTSTGNQFAALFLSGASSDYTISSSLTDLAETLPAKLLDWGFVGSANNSKSLCFDSQWIKFDPKEFFGKKVDVLYADFQGSASASPVEQAFFNILVGAWDRSADTDTVQCLVELEFVAAFSEPKPLPSS